MNHLESYDEQAMEIWLKMAYGESFDKSVLSPDVYDSWQRCRRMGVDPFLERAPVIMDESELALEIERNAEFMAVALPVMHDLYSIIKGSRFGVFIANENGIVLRCEVDPDGLETCQEKCLQPGADWSEKSCGNNAIGTSLYLRRPVQFTSFEHYCRVGHVATCSAAPIFGPEGELLGTLNITGFKENAHIHTLGMVVAGAAAIQRELGLRAMHHRLETAHRYMTEMMESLPSGVVTVSPEGVIRNANQKACEILKTSKEELIGNNALQMFDSLSCLNRALRYGKIQEDSETYIMRNGERLHFIISVRPIISASGVPDGAVIVLREIEAVMRMTSKLAGHRARITFENIIGCDPKLVAVIEQARRAALSLSNILLQGESGTGKEMFAQAIHNESPRRYGPFIAVNCGAIPRELIGSELFGYEEGAFTGAKKGGSPGKFELANNGTLFLDEIGDMPLDQQLALLRVLQDKKVTRLGGSQEIAVNVRLIAATNKNLQDLVAEGRFRKDLFFRLNVITLNLPPLRERTGDIELLVHHFLALQCRKLGVEVPQISKEAMKMLKSYQWPGNIRELENILERAVVLHKESVLDVDAFPLPEEGFKELDEIDVDNNNLSLKSGERALIIKALEESKGNVTRAAHRLGISRVTLYRKLRHYHIEC